MQGYLSLALHCSVLPSIYVHLPGVYKWLTKRTLKLKFIESVGQPVSDDFLTEEDIRELLKLHR